MHRLVAIILRPLGMALIALALMIFGADIITSAEYGGAQYRSVIDLLIDFFPGSDALTAALPTLGTGVVALFFVQMPASLIAAVIGVSLVVLLNRKEEFYE